MSTSSRAVKQPKSTTAEERKPQLSVRQREILELLCAGKVNKEIARELGIGVGTVKQHLVVLFKRLNVRNRAMAVARAAELLGEDGTAADPFVHEEMLIRRPCVALTVALGEAAEGDTQRRFHRAMAGLAYDSNALFLQRDSGIGALLFGIKRPSEHDLVVALHVAECLAEELSERSPRHLKGFKAVLAAGLATISRDRYGNWLGDTVATPVLKEARRELEDCSMGEIGFSPGVVEVMRAFGFGDVDEPLHTLGLDELGRVRRAPSEAPSNGSHIGREGEIAALSDFLQTGSPGLILVEGETGMGKSRLCRHAIAMASAEAREAHLVRAIPGLFERPFWNMGDGSILSLSELAGRVWEDDRHGLLVLDDIHLLNKQRRQSIFDLLGQFVEGGGQAVLAGRRIKEADQLDAKARLHLRRLGDPDIRAVVSGVRGDMNDEGVARLSKDAAGIPLFARELAYGKPNGTPTLALLMTVAARLDGLKLDWRVLHMLCGDVRGMTVPELAARLAEPETAIMGAVKRAIEAGVLCSDQKDTLTFRNPLIRKVIEYLGVD